MGRKRTGGTDEHGGRRYARITVTLEDGSKKRVRTRLDAALPKKRAKAEAKKLSTEAQGFVFPARATGAAPAPALLSCESYAEAWDKDRVRRGRRTELGRFKKHISELIGSKSMDAVTKDDARAISAALDEKVLAGENDWSTVTKVWGVVKKMF